MADPFAWRTDDAYYAVGTGAAGAGTVAGGAAGGTAGAVAKLFPVLRSTDFCTWTHQGEALVRPAGDLGEEFWAPAVATANGLWYLYYSVGDARIPRHQLRVAIAAAPAGPYLDEGPLTYPDQLPFAIDAHPVQDHDGGWWLFYARDFLDQDDGCHAGTALVADRLIGMTRLAGDERVVLRARHAWTLFAAQRHLYGQVWDWHTLEGPCVVPHDGRWWCFYSGACWGNDTYGVDYAVAERLEGPWRDDGADAGPRVLRTVRGLARGPGHVSCVVGPDGADYLAYHAWDGRGAVRRMHLDRILWTPEGPRCRPTRKPQLLTAAPAPAGDR
jgi:beta-xylosidase